MTIRDFYEQAVRDYAKAFVLEGYGITECSPGASFPDEHQYMPGTVGTPLNGMEWRIVNSDETGAGGQTRSNDEMASVVRQAVREICHASLAEYKLPRKVDVRFVPLEHTSSMKVKRFIYARALDE